MAVQAGLCLAWWKTPEDMFCSVVAHLHSCASVKLNLLKSRVSLTLNDTPHKETLGKKNVCVVQVSALIKLGMIGRINIYIFFFPKFYIGFMDLKLCQFCAICQYICSSSTKKCLGSGKNLG